MNTHDFYFHQKYGASETSPLEPTVSSSGAMQKSKTSSKYTFPIIDIEDLPIRPASTGPMIMRSNFNDAWATKMNGTRVTHRFEEASSLPGPARTDLSPVAMKASLEEPCSSQSAPTSTSSPSDKSEVVQPKLQVTQPEPDVVQPKPKAVQPSSKISSPKPADLSVVPADALPKPEFMESKPAVAPPRLQATQSKPITTPLIPKQFLNLLQILQKSINEQNLRPRRGNIAITLMDRFPDIYKQAGVTRWKEYAELAEKAGFVVLGGQRSDTWITLHPDWHGRVPRAETVHK